MKNKGQTIVVTGGAGFIGSHLTDRLLLDGYNVVCIDNFDDFYDPGIKRKNIEHHLNDSSYSLQEIDIRNYDALTGAIPGDTKAIIHLAAKAGVRPSLENPVLYQDVNVKGTQNLLEAAKEKGIEHFVFSSSSSVYGKNPNVPWSEEDQVLMPISPYASTKVSGELMGHVYSHLYGIRFIALRLFTVYGPRQRPDLAIHKFFRLIDDGKEIVLYGDGSTRRDYTYVSDIVDGFLKALSYNQSLFEIINLGNNRTIKLLELVTEIENAMGTEAVKTFEDEQPGDVSQTWADISKAERLLGYNPEYSLEKGLREFHNWFTTIRSVT